MGRVNYYVQNNVLEGLYEVENYVHLDQYWVGSQLCVLCCHCFIVLGYALIWERQAEQNVNISTSLSARIVIYANLRDKLISFAPFPILFAVLIIAYGQNVKQALARQIC